MTAILNKPLVVKTVSSPAPLQEPEVAPAFDVTPFRAMIYGASGTSKTSQIAHYCRTQWKEHKRRTRYITFDAGGHVPFEVLARAGAADVWNARDLAGMYPPDQTESVVRGIFEGAWPVPAGNGKLKWQRSEGDILVVEGLDGVCAFIETSWISIGRKIAEDLVGRYEVLDLVTGSSQTGGRLGRAHYGAIQTLVINTLLPTLWATPYKDIILTTHESNGKDADEGTPGGVVYGPAAIGKAITSKMRQQTPVLLRTDKVVKKDDVEYRCYFEDHTDPNRPNTIGATYPANARLPLESIQAFKAKYPGQFFTLTPKGELAEFLTFWKKLQTDAATLL